MANRTLGWWVTLYGPLMAAIAGIGMGAMVVGGWTNVDVLLTYGAWAMVAAIFLAYISAITTPVGMYLDQKQLKKSGQPLDQKSTLWYVAGIVFAPLVGAAYLIDRRKWASTAEITEQ